MEDHSCMYRRYVAGMKGITIEFERGVNAFVSFVVSNSISGNIRCPCAKCKNMQFEEPGMVKVHLYRQGLLLITMNRYLMVKDIGHRHILLQYQCHQRNQIQVI